MTLDDGARVFGQVREATGSGVPNSFLSVVIGFGPLFSFTVSNILTDAQGSFDFDFVPRIGTLSLTAQHPQTLANGVCRPASAVPANRCSSTRRSSDPAACAGASCPPMVSRRCRGLRRALPWIAAEARGFAAVANELGEFVFTDVPVGVLLSARDRWAAGERAKHRSPRTRRRSGRCRHRRLSTSPAKAAPSSDGCS